MTTSSTTDERFDWGSACVIVATIIGLLISTWVLDTQGRKENNHPEGLPAAVSQLSDTAYIVERGSISAFELCSGAPSGDDEEINETAQIPKLDAIYIECSKDQTWDDQRPQSINFGHAFIKIITLPWTWLSFGVLLLLYVPAIVSLISDVRRHRRELRAARQKALGRRSEAAVRHDALVAAWGKDEISDLEYDTKFSKLVEKYPELLDRQVDDA